MFDIFPSLPLFGFLVGEGLKYATRSPQQWAQEGDQIITPSGRQENLNSSPPFSGPKPMGFFFGKGFKGQNPPGFCCYSTATFKGFLAQDSFSWSHILQVLPKANAIQLSDNAWKRARPAHVLPCFVVVWRSPKTSETSDLKQRPWTWRRRRLPGFISSYETNPKSYTTIVSGKPLKKT